MSNIQHAILPLFGSVLFLSIGIAVYFLGTGENRKRFLRFCYFTFHWQFSWFWIFFLNDPKYADLIVRIGYSGIIFLPIVFFESVFGYLGVKVKTKFYYFLGSIFLICLWTTNWFAKGAYKYSFGFYPEAGWLHVIYMLMVTYMIISSIYIMWKAQKEETDQIRRSQLRIFLIATITYSMAATDYLLNYPALLKYLNVDLYPVGIFFIIVSLLIFILAHFTALTSQLKNVNVTLEKKVLEKTRGLEEKEEQLKALNLGLEDKIKERTKELEDIKSGLEITVAQRTADLSQKVSELERMNKLMTGRELRIIELKETIKNLEGKREAKQK